MTISTLARKGLSVVAAGSLAVGALVSAVAPASAVGSDSLDVTVVKGLRAGVDYSGDVLASAELTTANDDDLNDTGSAPNASLIVVSQPSGGGIVSTDLVIDSLGNNDTTADIEFKNNGGPNANGEFAVAGDYTFRFTSAKGVAKDFTITVGGAPASVVLAPAQNPYPAGESLSWTVTLKDSAGRLTSLDSEALYVETLDGFGNAATSTSVTAFDSADGVYTVSATAPAAGSTVFRALLDASTDIYSANVTLVTKAKASLSTGSGQTFKASGSGIAGTGVSASSTSGSHTIRTDVPTVTYVLDAKAANADSFVKFTVANVSGLGATGDLTSAPKSATWVLTDAAGKASVAVTAKSPEAADQYTVVATDGSATKTITSTYRAAGYGIAFKVVSPVVSDNNERHVAIGSSTVVSFKLTDVFGTPQANKRVTLGFDVADFAPAPSTGDTNADGVVSVTLADTAKTARTETVSVSFTSGANSANESIDLIYVADATPASVNVTVTYRGGAAHNATTNNGTQPLYIDVDDTGSYSDVVETEVTVKNATGGVLIGVPVTVTGGFSAADSAADQAADMEATTEFVTDGSTQYVNLLSQKTGTITFTFTAGGKSATVTQVYANTPWDASSLKAVAASASAVSGTYKNVSFKVTDKYDNAVAGVSVLISASGVGRMATGLTSASVTTDSNGIAGADVVSAATDAGVLTVTGSSWSLTAATSTVTWAVAVAPAKASARAGAAKGTVVVAMGNLKGKSVQVFVKGKLVVTVTPASNYVSRVIKGLPKGAATVVIKSGDFRYTKKVTIK